MSLLEPHYTTKVEFKNGELDADDPLVQWVVNVARGANDLLLASRRLEQDLAVNPEGHETIYDARAAAVHAWELAKFLRDSEKKSAAVSGFIATCMHEEAVKDYRLALAALEPPAGSPPEEGSFKTLLVKARDQGAHYSSLGSKQLRGAIKRLGGAHDEVVGSVYLGDSFKDFYAKFAAELDYQLFLSVHGDDMEPLKEFTRQLNQVAAHLIRFAVSAVQAYLNHYSPPSTAVIPLPLDGSSGPER